MMSPIPTLNIDNKLSLYIPVIETDVANLEYIRNVFHSLNIGAVKRVEFKTSECGYTMRAFVHFDHWYQNVCVSNLQERILGEEGEGRLVYDDPKYWILKKNTKPIPDNYAKQLEEVREHNLKNYAYLLEYIQTLHSTINEQGNIIEKLNWWNNLHETNIQYLCEEVQHLKDQNTVPHVTVSEAETLTETETERDNNWLDEGRLRKRRLLNNSTSSK